MVESEKSEPPSYDVAVVCLEELENMLSTTAMKTEDTPVGKFLVLVGINLLCFSKVELIRHVAKVSNT